MNAPRKTNAKDVAVPRPIFKPCWTEAEAVEMANNHLAPDAVAQAGYRFAAVILARPVEDLMAGSLASSGDGEEGRTGACSVDGGLRARRQDAEGVRP
jgi:hypothetical protein